MSRATGTATIPSYAAVLSQLLQIPKSPAQFTPRAVYAKRRNTATAPMNAPGSGRLRSAVTMPTRARRSSGGTVATVGSTDAMSRLGADHDGWAEEGAAHPVWALV